MFKNWFGKSEEEPAKPKRKNTERLTLSCVKCGERLSVAHIQVAEIPHSSARSGYTRGKCEIFYKCPICQNTEAIFQNAYGDDIQANRFEKSYGDVLVERWKLRYAGFDEDILPETFKSFDNRLIEIASEQAIAVSLAEWENEDVSD